MKIKFIIITCLLLNFTPATTQASVVTMPAPTTFDYLPILDYQKSLMAFLCNFSGSCIQPAEEMKTDIEMVEETSHPVEMTQETQTTMQKTPREQALEDMKLITTKIFDPNDTELVGKHFVSMRDLTNLLDEDADKKTITAVHFLLENQHRASWTDMAFWLQSNNKYELSTAIPVTEEVAKNSKANATLLLKKMAAQKEFLKKELAEKLKAGQAAQLEAPVAVAAA